MPSISHSLSPYLHKSSRNNQQHPIQRLLQLLCLFLLPNIHRVTQVRKQTLHLTTEINLSHLHHSSNTETIDYELIRMEALVMERPYPDKTGSSHHLGQSCSPRVTMGMPAPRLAHTAVDFRQVNPLGRALDQIRHLLLQDLLIQVSCRYSEL